MFSVWRAERKEKEKDIGKKERKKERIKREIISALKEDLECF